MIIDARRPEGWRKFLEEAVYRPAGIYETFTRVAGLDCQRFAMPHRFNSDGSYSTLPFLKIDATMNSAGGHLATLRDLARWVTVHLEDGVIDGHRVFPSSAVRLSHRTLASQTLPAAKKYAYFDRAGWAMGWDVGSYEGEPMLSRFGSYSSLRSHLSMLPGRHIGVVAQANGAPGAAATDVIAAYAYDLEAGRANAREVLEQRFGELVRRLAQAKQQTSRSDSVRRTRQRPMDRPARDLTGEYVNEILGTVRFDLRGDTLWYTWGAINGPAEVFDATRHQLRIELVDHGTPVSFTFENDGPATMFEIQGDRFVRTP
jgi:CubicO group peptidase (beta-lactamase class C family)